MLSEKSDTFGSALFSMRSLAGGRESRGAASLDYYWVVTHYSDTLPLALAVPTGRMPVLRLLGITHYSDSLPLALALAVPTGRMPVLRLPGVIHYSDSLPLALALAVPTGRMPVLRLLGGHTLQ